MIGPVTGLGRARHQRMLMFATACSCLDKARSQKALFDVVKMKLFPTIWEDRYVPIILELHNISICPQFFWSWGQQSDLSHWRWCWVVSSADDCSTPDQRTHSLAFLFHLTRKAGRWTPARRPQLKIPYGAPSWQLSSLSQLYPSVRLCHGWPSHRWSNRAFKPTRDAPCTPQKVLFRWLAECFWYVSCNKSFHTPATYLHGDLPLHCCIGRKDIFQGLLLLPSRGVGGFRMVNLRALILDMAKRAWMIASWSTSLCPRLSRTIHTDWHMWE